MRKDTILTECPDCKGKDNECDECEGTGIVEVCMNCKETLHDNECGCER